MSSLSSKKAFDRVWHAALWATMRKYNISANLIRTIEQLYEKYSPDEWRHRGTVLNKRWLVD